MKIKLSILLFLISVLSFSQDKKTIKNFVESFVEYRMKDGKFIKRTKGILAVGMLNSEEFKNSKLLSIHFTSIDLLSGYPYKSVFKVKDFKTIVYENEFAHNFNGIFKRMPYEVFNLAKYEYNYNPKMWNFVFNNKSEIVIIYGFQGNFELIEFLKTKGFKFSKDFKENMDLD
ncbi:hypothetical protein [Epilithonimonas tenax]|uniref:hypothetical protein n=1 Tax=Epilithonimonas tenax TaxID=191577 RepID=UPI000427E6AD|nr:hypothetical protein [Epilithonimonas tenax]